MNETEVQLFFPVPILIKSLVHQNKAIKVKFLPFSFELNKCIRNKFFFYKMFPTNYELLKRFLSIFNFQIKKKNDWAYVWASFITIDDTKILIIFKRETEIKIEGFLYLNSIRKENNRVSELLIQTLILGYEELPYSF